MHSLLGIRLTRGGSTHVVLRATWRAEPVYTNICDTVKQAPWTVLDETGWHVGGHNAIDFFSQLLRRWPAPAALAP